MNKHAGERNRHGVFISAQVGGLRPQTGCCFSESVIKSKSTVENCIPEKQKSYNFANKHNRCFSRKIKNIFSFTKHKISSIIPDGMANPTQEERSRTGGSKSPHALGRKGPLQWAGVTRADMHLAP